VVWQTAFNPLIALELLATGVWQGEGVLGGGDLVAGGRVHRDPLEWCLSQTAL
jgi:hypothetical protein